MYLSKLILNKGYEQVRRDLNDCQQMHRTILSCLPFQDNRNKNANTEVTEARLLYRVERNPETKEAMVLVQSVAMPDWSKLPDTYLKPIEDSMICKSIAFFFNRIKEGQILSFRLRANPTGRDEHEKRRPLTEESKLISWLKRKGTQHGFEIVNVVLGNNIEYSNVVVSKEHYLSGWRANGREKKKLIFNSVVFQGQITVTDKEKFLIALKGGIGSAKGYGFGLLSVGLAS